MRVMSEEEETDGKVRSPEGLKGGRTLRGGEEVEFDAPGKKVPKAQHHIGGEGTLPHPPSGPSPPSCQSILIDFRGKGTIPLLLLAEGPIWPFKLHYGHRRREELEGAQICHVCVF